MLEDLDHLAARIGQLVQRSREFDAERESLRVRLQEADADRRALRERCDDAEAGLQAAQARLAEYDQTLAVEKSRAERVQAGLRASLEQQAAEYLALMSRHDACRAELQRLRAVTSRTRERIDAVLVRLPGAQPAEPQQAQGGQQS